LEAERFAERELSLPELERILLEHERHQNFAILQAFCCRYYPSATRVMVDPSQNYDDQVYYYRVGPDNLNVYAGEQRLSLADDEVSLLLLLAGSPDLQRQLEAENPEDPVLWLADLYYEEVCALGLYGVEHGHSFVVDFAHPPPVPTRVYVKES
jgi:hypothetical protein